MKRGSHGDFFLKLLERIRATIPGVAIRTSMIVGFPGETDADFEILCDFVKAAQFDRLGVFSYSDEDTSASFQLDAKVDGRTIHNRKQQADGRAAADFESAGTAKMIGREVDVLIEGPSRGYRSAVAGAHVHAGARNRRILLCERFCRAPRRAAARSAGCASPKRMITI